MPAKNNAPLFCGQAVGLYVSCLATKPQQFVEIHQRHPTHATEFVLNITSRLIKLPAPVEAIILQGLKRRSIQWQDNGIAKAIGLEQPHNLVAKAPHLE